MLPKLQWDSDYEERGIYFPEVNIIVIHPKQKTSPLFASILHEVGHWLLFRLGQSDAVHQLNCAWDCLDYIVTNKKIPKQDEVI